ncbi:MAG: hypothetical protein ACLFUB_08615 [Cyclobacteriaceae bacterium]
MPQLNEVYRSKGGCIYQDDVKNCFILEYSGQATPLSVPCFFCLKKTLDRVDVVSMATNTCLSSDFEIISSPGCDRCFVLSLPELLDMKDLFAGARVMLELNSILHERIYTPIHS